jgi:hypothetical protein
VTDFNTGDVVVVYAPFTHTHLAVVAATRQADGGEVELWLVQQGTAALPAAGEGDGVWVKASECRHWAPDGGTAFLVTDAGPRPDRRGPGPAQRAGGGRGVEVVGDRP